MRVEDRFERIDDAIPGEVEEEVEGVDADEMGDWETGVMEEEWVVEPSAVCAFVISCPGEAFDSSRFASVGGVVVPSAATADSVAVSATA